MKAVITTLTLCFFAISVLTPANAQEVASIKDETLRKFQVIRTEKLDTFEKELIQLGEQGYRLERMLECVTIRLQTAIMSIPTDGDQQTKFEYKLLKDSNVKDLQKLVDEAAQNGFEVRGIISATIPYLQGQIGLVVERVSGKSSVKFQYKIVQTINTDKKEFQDDLDKLIKEGFHPIKITNHIDVGPRLFLGMGGPKNIIVLSKSIVDTPSQPVEKLEYKFLDTDRISTMEKELNAVAKENYRLFLTAQIGVVGVMRTQNQSQQKFEYKLHELKEKKRDADLATYTQEGYNFRATFIGSGGVTAILERELSAKPQPLSRTYKFMKIPEGSGEKTVFSVEMTKAVAEGFRILDFSGTLGKMWIVLVK